MLKTYMKTCKLGAPHFLSNQKGGPFMVNKISTHDLQYMTTMLVYCNIINKQMQAKDGDSGSKKLEGLTQGLTIHIVMNSMI